MNMISLSRKRDENILLRSTIRITSKNMKSNKVDEYNCTSMNFFRQIHYDRSSRIDSNNN